MKLLLTAFFFLAYSNVYSQKEDVIGNYLSFQYNKTIHDRTITNNSSGIGFGFEFIGNTGSSLRPVLQVNGNLFVGTKVLYLTIDDKVIDGKEMVATIFGGARKEVGKQGFASFSAGAAFYNDKAYFGLRPGIGVYTSPAKKVGAQVSYTNIFQRDEISNQNFGFLSFSIGLKLF